MYTVHQLSFPELLQFWQESHKSDTLRFVQQVFKGRMLFLLPNNMFVLHLLIEKPSSIHLFAGFKFKCESCQRRWTVEQACKPKPANMQLIISEGRKAGVKERSRHHLTEPSTSPLLLLLSYDWHRKKCCHRQQHSAMDDRDHTMYSTH